MGIRKLISIILICGPGLLFPQQEGSSSDDRHCGEFLKEGWVVPGLVGSKIQARGPLMSSESMKSTLPKNFDGVFLSVLKPGETESWLIVPVCSAAPDKAPEFRTVPIEILKLWSFDAGGAPFAYRVEYGDERIHQDGTRGHLASASVVFFFDTDGTGRFTLTRPSTMSGSNYFFPDFVPDWAKRVVAVPAQK